MLALRRFADPDITRLATWLDAAHVSPWFEDKAAWLDEVRRRNSTFSFIQHFIAEVAGRPVGFCQFYCCSDAGEAEYAAFPADSTYSLDYLIGSPTDLRHGYGRAMLGALIEQIKAQPTARLIAVCPDAENLASAGLLHSLGFTPRPGNAALCLDL